MNAIVKTPLPAATIAPDVFRRVFRNWVGAVSVVAVGQDEERRGFTVTSAAPLEAEPASLLVCVNAHGSSFDAFAPGVLFSVNVLAEDQTEIADVFAGRTGLSAWDRFRSGAWGQKSSEPPRLEGALASLVCSVAKIVTFGSHAIVIGDILDAHSTEGGALAYWRGAYHALPKVGGSSSV